MLLVVISLALFFAAVILLVRTRRWLLGCKVCLGTVIDRNKSPGMDNSNWEIIIKVDDGHYSGRVFVDQYRIGNDRSKRLLGKTVRIYYSADRDDDVRFKSDVVSPYFPAYVMLILSLAFFVFGLGFEVP